MAKYLNILVEIKQIIQKFQKDKNNEICAKALIDLDDVDKVKNIKWHRSELQRSTYYCLSNDPKWKRIHRLIWVR